MTKDFNVAFRKLVQEAIDNGWRAIWHDLCDGNDVFFPDEDTAENVTNYFHFISPEEMKGWD